MGRLTNDFMFALGKTPRTVIQYINQDYRMTEIPFTPTHEQGTAQFRIRVKGEDRDRKWNLVYPPYIDDLGRRVYVCPFWATTNVDYSMLKNGGEEMINALMVYTPTALDQEFAEGIEFEAKRRENKPFKKKPFPIGIVLVCAVIALFVGLIATFFFLGH